MPSFDIVSEVSHHELDNAIDQANREVANRFDFKGSDAKFECNNNQITLTAKEDFQLKQMMDIMRTKFAKREIDLRCLDVKAPEIHLNHAKQIVQVKQGIDKDAAKKITKAIKESKIKVQAAIQGEQVRVTGKKRDDLQSVISLLKASDIALPLQMINFRD